MAKFLCVLAITILTAQSAVIQSKDGSLKRARRSCDPCEHNHQGPPGPPGPPPPPPPPPPMGPPPPPPHYHAEHFTGFVRSKDGSQHGVFSGAAATAQGDEQATGEAFSLASANSGSASSGQYSNNAQQEQAPFASNSELAQTQASNAVGSSGHFGGESGSFSGSSSHSDSEAVGSGQSRGDFGGNAGGQYDNGFGHSRGGSGHSNGGYGHGGGSSGYSNGGFGQYGSSSGSNGGASGQYGGGSGQGANGGYGHGSGYNTQSQQSAQESLHGALDLASKGLQAQVPSGCTTCGTKSNYAFSNAKSESGNAIAVSTNG